MEFLKVLSKDMQKIKALERKVAKKEKKLKEIKKKITSWRKSKEKDDLLHLQTIKINFDRLCTSVRVIV